MLLLAQGLYRAYQAAKYEVTRQRCSGVRNVATSGEVPGIRGNIARRYLANGKSYEKSPSRC